MKSVFYITCSFLYDKPSLRNFMKFDLYFVLASNMDYILRINIVRQIILKARKTKHHLNWFRSFGDESRGESPIWSCDSSASRNSCNYAVPY
jgi:hypothetical protein